MKSYVVHTCDERARFRHDLFKDEDIKNQAIDLLQKEEGILGVKPGHSSLLIFFEPETDLEAVCEKLETVFPDLKREPEQKPQTPAIQHRMLKIPGVRNFNHRKCMVKIMLYTGLTTVGMIAFGFKHLHAWAGGAFALLATNHVWERRKML